MRWLESAAVISVVVVATTAPAQTTIPATNAAPEPEEETWSLALSAYTYFIPDDDDYVQPTITADHGRLHLEARYNYEDQNTASVWAGYNLAGGEKLAWEITPMLGGVFGDTSGVAPGYLASLSWWKFALYSEGEYVIDTGDSSDSFFYNWSELTFAPVEWFRFGMVTQRTRAYEADRDIQRGVLVGVTYKQLDVSGYVLNPDDEKPIVAIALRLSF
jgi:hypothetical protein